MFKNDYNNSFDNIKPENNLKQDISEKITVTENEKKPKRMVYFTRSAVAIAAALAIAFSAWTINKNFDGFGIKESVQKETVKELNCADSYKEVFKRLKKLQKTNNISLFQYKSARNEYAVEEYAYEDSADTGVTTKPGMGAVNEIAADSVEEKTETATDINGAQLKDDGAEDFSSTTTQVDEVDEADVVKTDGEYIYILSRKNSNENSVMLKIVKAGEKPVLISSTRIDTKDFMPDSEMYICGKSLVILGSAYNEYSAKLYSTKESVNRQCLATVYDVSSPEKVQQLYTLEQSGYYSSSRMINNNLYLVSNFSVNTNELDEDEYSTYIPQVTAENIDGTVSKDCIIINKEIDTATYTVVSGYDITNGTLVSNISVLGGTDQLYCSTKNIITANFGNENQTDLRRFSINKGKIEYKASGSVEGYIHNQFSIDEYKGYFRFVTTATQYTETEHVRISGTTLNHLFIFDGSLKKVGEIKDLAPDERIKSARFMGDIAYFVTFRETDPLFSADLSNPQNPKIIGQLKIPGFSDYLYPFGADTLIGIGREQIASTGENLKLSLFDIADPANVTESAKFITDAQNSEALYNHKATFVDAKRQLIGFAEENYQNGYSCSYVIYGMEKGEFSLKYRLNYNEQYNSIGLRGLYIGKYFYIISPEFIQVIDYNNFSEIFSLDLSGN